MNKSRQLLSTYRYDPLDRLFANTAPGQSDAQRFYLKDRLATEVQGPLARSIMQYDFQLLAQRQNQGGIATVQLLVTDQQRCVLNLLEASPQALSYAVYGHSAPGGGLASLLGFNGERPDPVTGCYLLGNGYRAFNPVLMRFISPDSWSPFGRGGINPYTYCAGDPVNNRDDSGHVLGKLLNFLGVKRDGYKPLKTDNFRKTHKKFVRREQSEQQQANEISDDLRRYQAQLKRQKESLEHYRKNKDKIVEVMSDEDPMSQLVYGRKGQKFFFAHDVDKKIEMYQSRVDEYSDLIANLNSKPVTPNNLPQTASNIRK